ncbi:hypothetical protein BKA69DRAFT_1060770 [Paraphysoderma sedebokerense]|nr:hypothetical protein BKA69DRAFT_1060770 [Paraphysoderma sedebokerense]
MSALSPSSSSFYKHLGCYNDRPSARDLSGPTFDNCPNTAACFGFCLSNGFTHFGLSDGNKCLCGNSFGSLGKSETGCNKPCSGENVACGGNLATTVYEISGSSTGKSSTLFYTVLGIGGFFLLCTLIFYFLYRRERRNRGLNLNLPPIPQLPEIDTSHFFDNRHSLLFPHTHSQMYRASTFPGTPIKHNFDGRGGSDIALNNLKNSISANDEMYGKNVDPEATLARPESVAIGIGKNESQLTLITSGMDGEVSEYSHDHDGTQSIVSEPVGDPMRVEPTLPTVETPRGAKKLKAIGNAFRAFGGSKKSDS